MGPFGAPAWLSDEDQSDGAIGIRCTRVDELEGARIGFTILRAIEYIEKLARRIP